MDEIEILDSAIRQQYARVVWTHKIQIKQADLYERRHSFLKCLEIITAGITSIGLASLIFTDEQWITIGTGIVSLISFCSTTYLETFKINKKATRCKDTACRLVEIREQLLNLLTQIKTNRTTYERASENYNSIVEQLVLIYKAAPTTTPKAVKEARKALEKSEDDCFTCEEINRFLPECLRRTCEFR